MDENKQAVLLLCTHFSASKKGDPTPLTAIEYGRFALWLKNNAHQPADLFHDFDAICDAWRDSKNKVTPERLKFLLGRGMAMGLALEKWQSAGIWFLTRADIEYPNRLKTKLATNAPPILFGVGNKRLLNAGGLAVVGSREIDNEDEQYAANVAKQAANEGLNLVSGGARGVDEVAMFGALSVEGTAVGILANDLYKTAIAKKWRPYLKNNQLALISPFYPEASFQVGNAMNRNKYIYCLSDYALAVRSEEGKGGTWAGAIENLKQQWVPLFVKAGSSASGSIALLASGAAPLSIPCDSESGAEWLLAQLRGSGAIVAKTVLPVSEPNVPAYQEDKTAQAEQPTESDADEDVAVCVASIGETPSTEVTVAESVEDERSEETVKAEGEPAPGTQYMEFVQRVTAIIGEAGEVKLAQLKGDMPDLSQKQITAWLDLATEKEVLVRKGRARTYELKKGVDLQLNLFGDR